LLGGWLQNGINWWAVKSGHCTIYSAWRLHRCSTNQASYTRFFSRSIRESLATVGCPSGLERKLERGEKRTALLVGLGDGGPESQRHLLPDDLDGMAESAVALLRDPNLHDRVTTAAVARVRAT